ncbi:MAG: TonB-dependent siderophore receptor [Waterburya sp.]
MPTFTGQIISRGCQASQRYCPNPTWKMTNSFRAAYITWDQTNNISTSQKSTERDFDYEEFPLEQFYNLILETNQEFETATLEQATTIGIEVNKNPFLISGEGIESLISVTQTLTNSVLPSPYLTRDFISKKNYLGLFVEHEITLSDRLSLNFEGTLDVIIEDNTDLPELPAIEPIENNNFYPEINLDYELTDNIFIFTTVSYSAESMEGTDAKNQPFDSEVYQGVELGIETEINSNLWASLYFYHETQNNITTIDPNEPDFDLQINQQKSQSWTGEIRGQIIPGWWIYGFYTYTNAQVTKDEEITVGSLAEGVAHHSGSLWTSYEATQGIWKGLGFGAGCLVNGNRPGDTANGFTLPSYLQTDAAIFYTQDNFKAAVSVQNLFNAGIKDDEEVTKRSLFGTVWFQF